MIFRFVHILRALFFCFNFYVRLCASFSRSRFSAVTTAAVGCLSFGKLGTLVRLPNFIATGCFDFANSFTSRPAKKGSLSHSLNILQYVFEPVGRCKFTLCSCDLFRDDAVCLSLTVTVAA